MGTPLTPAKSQPYSTRFWHIPPFPLACVQFSSPFSRCLGFGEFHHEMGVTLASARCKSRESSALPSFTVWGLDKSSELSVSKGELFIRHGRPGSFRSLKCCTTWKNYHWENCCSTPGKFRAPPQVQRNSSFSLKRLQEFLNLAIFVFQNLFWHIG